MCQNKIFEKLKISLTRKLCQKEIPRVSVLDVFEDREIVSEFKNFLKGFPDFFDIFQISKCQPIPFGSVESEINHGQTIFSPSFEL